MSRIVAAEILDNLPAEAPEARGSRSDLGLLNRLMGHARIIRAAIGPDITHVVDLGAGDGTLLLRVLGGGSANVKQVTLVDRQRVVSEETLAEFRSRNIDVEVVVADVFAWLTTPRRHQHTAIVANLFLHHFQSHQLLRLLEFAAASCDSFVACEPRRAIGPAVAALLLGVIGCNRVTRHDARVSVRAGFRGRELGRLWPAHAEWHIEEKRVGLFSHRFVARRL